MQLSVAGSPGLGTLMTRDHVSRGSGLRCEYGSSSVPTHPRRELGSEARGKKVGELSMWT